MLNDHKLHLFPQLGKEPETYDSNLENHISTIHFHITDEHSNLGVSNTHFEKYMKYF